MTVQVPPEDEAIVGEETDRPATVPPVVAVVITRDPGPCLEATLVSLGAQDYPALSVLVMDAGSEYDLTSRVAAASPTAFVRRISGTPGFGAAANEGFAAIEGATFFLVCHDDVVLDERAVRIMVEEAYRSNAGIVGPKLVSADDPDVLLEVGRAIDHLGGPFTGIEPGELDQEQHDAVRDVFYVSSAVMLVRADLFVELGGFDPDAFPGAEDLDLCWRVRLAGGRVMVAPDARVGHHVLSDPLAASDQANPRTVARRRIRVVLSSYAFASLLWVIPLGLTISFLESIAFALTRRRRDAFATLGGWWWNLVHWRRLRPARKRTQRLRRVPDRELRELQVGLGTRVGAFLEHHHADERAESFGERGRDLFSSIAESLRHPASLGFVIFVALVLFGSRNVITHGVPSIGTNVAWPGVRQLVTEFSSAWRHTGLGSTASAPPVLAMMAVLGTALLGSVGTAHTVVVVGAFILGSAGAFRLARGIAGSHGAAAVAATAYGVSAVPRNAVANGRLGPLVLYALAPFLVLLVVRAAKFAGMAGSARRPLLGLVIMTAIATAWYPPAILLTIAVAAAFLVASVLTGEVWPAVRALGVAVIAGAGAAALLMPWTLTLLDARHDRSALGLAFHVPLSLGDVVRFATGPNGGAASWGLVVAALAALVLATGSRLVWAIRAWVLVILGLAVVWLPARFSADSLVAAPEAGLTVAALGLALAAGLATSALAELPRRVGWRVLVGAAALLGVTFATLGFLADTFDGAWRAPDGWSSALAFTQIDRHAGDFRILWLGDASVLPLDPAPVDGSLSYVLSRGGPGDASQLLRAPTTSADDTVVRAVQSARHDATSRLGRMLAVAGVRYIVITERSGPGAASTPVAPGLTAALGNQLDLTRLGGPSGLVIFQNQAWAPIRSVVPDDAEVAVPKRSKDPLRAASGVDLSGATSIGIGKVGAGTVLFGEAYDGGWSATSNGRTLSHAPAFGVINGWKLSKDGTVSITHDGQGLRWLLVVGELLAWILVLVWWGRGRQRKPRVRAEPMLREPASSSFFDPVHAEDFWDEL